MTAIGIHLVIVIVCRGACLIAAPHQMPNVGLTNYGCPHFFFRSKVIGMDDLLLDYFQSGKKDKLKVKAAKSKHGPKGGYDSGEEDDRATQQEITVCKIFEEVQQKVIHHLPQPLLLPVLSCLLRI
jgi:hypothetical protein